MPEIVLYSYFRSSCSWRVRLVLSLKRLQYEYRGVHLVQGDQLKDDYIESTNHLGQVPTILVDDHQMTQSVAIMEFLEERFTTIPLLPTDSFERAKVREIVEIINAGTQPLQNLSVMRHHSDDPEERVKWSAYYIRRGLKAVEKILKVTAGEYCVGNQVTLADCCLIPQVYNANRFKVDMKEFPIICSIVDTCQQLDAFKEAAPNTQPDCPEELK